MREKNQVKSNSMIFEYLGIISFTATAFICAWSYSIFKLLFTEQYLSGYIIAPYLFLAPLLQMLFQVAGNQFLIIKKTWPNMLILLTGAIINILINWTLIPILGIEGAAIATLIGYIVSDAICVIVLCRMKLMVVSGKFVVSAGLMIIFLSVWRLFFSKHTFVGTILAIIVTITYMYLYKEDLKKVCAMIKGKN